MRCDQIQPGMTVHGLTVETVLVGPCELEVPSKGLVSAGAGEVVVVYAPTAAALTDAFRRQAGVDRVAQELRDVIGRQIVDVVVERHDAGPELLHESLSDLVGAWRATLESPEVPAERSVSVFDADAEVLP